ncbi:MAG: PIG-L family deacetylase [Deltaproteobacteria bacterium]|nr:PIG-L family deacetylase [Deltaproteobacteria bacterium]
MNETLPSANRVLVIAPHPDDESLGCGGTIVRYTQAGTRVALVVVSDGAALAEHGQHQSDLVTARQQETAAAAKVLGIHDVDALGFPDGCLMDHAREIQAALAACIAAFKPDTVFCPSPVDSHPDHIAVARVALQLLRTMPGWALAFYEVHAPVRPNVLVDVTEVLAVKERAILCYHRSLFGQPELFWAAVRGLNLSRSFFVQRHGFFEALWLLQAPMTDQEVVEWATYGFEQRSSHELTPSPLRAVDEMLFVLKEKTAEATQLKQQVEALQQEKGALLSALQEQARAVTVLQQTLELRDQELLTLQNSFVAWIRQFLYRRMDNAFPAGSRLRVVIRALNRLRSQNTSKSLSE